MEYPILIIILAIATIFLISFSTAVAMEEKIEFELPESGKVITFGDSTVVWTSGGLDPPADALSRETDDVQAADRFEMGESGILIDFSPLAGVGPFSGWPPASPSDRRFPGHAVPATTALGVYEMPESGRLIVFPRQVELRRNQAARMRPLERAASDNN